jgi:WD40 repeat protein
MLVTIRVSLFAVMVGSLAVSVSCGGDPEDAVIERSAALSPSNIWSVGSAGGPFGFAPGGAQLATGSTLAQAKILSAADGSLVRALTIRGTANAVAFSNDAALLAAGSSSNTLNLRMFRVSDGVRLFEVTAHANGTTGVAFSPTNSSQFATGGRDRTTKIWNTSGTLIRTMNDGIRVLAIAYSPDGTAVASNAQGNIHVWRVSDGALLRSFTATNTFTIAYSPNGQLISTGTQLWNASTGALVRNFGWPSGTVSSTTFTKDGAEVVDGGEDFPNSVDVATIRYFRVSDGAILATYDQIGGANAYVKSVAISPDGTKLGYTVATDNVTALATSPF